MVLSLSGGSGEVVEAGFQVVGLAGHRGAA